MPSLFKVNLCFAGHCRTSLWRRNQSHRYRRRTIANNSGVMRESMDASRKASDRDARALVNIRQISEPSIIPNFITDSRL